MQEKSSQKDSAPKLSPHVLELNRMSGASMTGIIAVPTFTDKTAVVRLKDETLTIQGQDLEIKALDVASGKLIMSGRINSLKYSASSAPTSLLKRLLK